MATKLKIRLCTWNLGNAAPPSDLSPWLGLQADTYDVVVIGAQECRYGSDEAPAARPVSAESSVSEDSPALLPFELSDAALTGNASSRSSLLSRAARSVRRIWSRPRPVVEASLPHSPIPSDTDRCLRTSSESDKCSIAAPDAEGKPLIAPTANDCSPSSPHAFRLRRRTHLNDLRRYRTDNVADQKAASSVSPGPLSKFTSFRARRLPQMCAKRLWSECGASDHPTDPLDESPLIQARECSDRVAPPPLPPYLENIDDPLAIDDTPSHVSVRLDASSGFPTKRTDQTAMYGIQECGESTDCSKSEEVSDPVETSSSDSDSDSRSPTGTGLTTTNASWFPGLNAVYMLGSPLQRKFECVVAKAMPEAYDLVAKRHMYEMTLLVYVHKRARDSVGKTEVMAVATGLCNVVGNKGAVVAKIRFDNTSFCFINSHLAAHEGKRYRNERHEQIAEIMRSIEALGPKLIPFLHQFDHIFWMGDLNYRLDMGRVLPAASSWSHERRFHYVTSLLEEGRSRDVASLDELRHAMLDEEVFPGFAEGALSFPPTFKVQRGGDSASVEYQPLRVPSYCDRVLWYSKTLHASHVKQREYNSVLSFCTSDHKPVFAVFEVVVPRKMVSSSPAAFHHALTWSLNFHVLNVKWLVSPATSTDEEQDKADMLGDRGRVGDDAANAFSGTENRAIDLRYLDGGSPKTLKKGSPKRDIVAVIQGSGVFAGDRTHKATLSAHHDGHVCGSERLPCIPLEPTADVNALMYKYVTISLPHGRRRFRRGCELPVASLINKPEHRISQVLNLTENGVTVGYVHVDVQLCITSETKTNVHAQ